MPPLSPFQKSCVAVAMSQIIALPTQAAMVTVTNAGDDGGGCTLREAIVSVNNGAAQSGCAHTGTFGIDDTIDFSLAGTQTITLLVDTLAIESDVVINGTGEDNLTVDGDMHYRVFSINNATVSLNSLTVSGGTDGARGGGIYAKNSIVSLNNTTVSGNVVDGFATSGGGIFAYSSNLTLNDSTVSGNSAYSTGAGISASEYSSVSLNNSRVSDNSATYYAGGIYVDESSVNVTNSTISGNLANSGAAMYALYSSVGLTNSTISNNQGDDGVLKAVDSSVSLIDSTVSGNSASAFDGGGGIYASGSSMRVVNSTISGNYSDGGEGAGIYASYSSSVSLINSTLTGNSIGTGGQGGGIFVTESSLRLVNTIVAGNAGATGAEIYSYASTVSANAANLFGNSSSTDAQAFYNFTPGSSDINATVDGSNIDLSTVIGPLQDNGCQQLSGLPVSAACVEAHNLISGSPAINAAKNSQCPDNDQRGQSRGISTTEFFVPIVTANNKLAMVDLGSSEGVCDIGAVEFSPEE